MMSTTNGRSVSYKNRARKPPKRTIAPFIDAYFLIYCIDLVGGLKMMNFCFLEIYKVSKAGWNFLLIKMSSL